MANIAEKTRVRVLTAKPLPSGKSVNLVGSVWYHEGDVHVVRIHTPGLYGGGIMRFAASELEAI